MVKVAGPAFSLDASGKLGGALVFSKWKGRNYIRSLVKPANPKSGGQVGMRSMFKFLSQEWSGLTDAEKATWEDRASALVASPFNGFMSYNQRRWRDFTGPSQEDPAAEISTPATGPTGVATPLERTMEIVLTDTVTAPDWGYAIFRSTGAIFTLAWANCVAIVPWDVAGTTTWIDAPLEPGTYYYNAIGLNDDGVKGADGTEFNGIIA